MYMDMFIYSFQNADISRNICFFWCHSFTMFKQTKSSVSWLNRKFSIEMVKVSFQNKNWAGYKCLVRKSEKMSLLKNFSKIWDVEFQKWHFLCSYVPEFHIYVSIHGWLFSYLIFSRFIIFTFRDYFTLLCKIVLCIWRKNFFCHHNFMKKVIPSCLKMNLKISHKLR